MQMKAMNRQLRPVPFGTPGRTLDTLCKYMPGWWWWWCDWKFRSARRVRVNPICMQIFGTSNLNRSSQSDIRYYFYATFFQCC